MAVLAETTLTGQWSTTGVAMTMTAGTAGGTKDTIAATADLILIAHNSGGSAYTITIYSTAVSPHNRTGDVSAQSLAAGEIRAFRLTNSGWEGNTTSGLIDVEVSNTAVTLGWYSLA